MTSQFTETFTGSFVSTGNPFQLALPSGVDYFELKNVTQWDNASSSQLVKTAIWHQAMTPGSALTTVNSVSAATDESDYLATGGFTPYADTGEALEVAIVGTTITQANPAVASATQTYQTGDVVRITKSTGMLQIAGWDFTVLFDSGSAFKLAYLDASGFGAAASAFKVQKVNPQSAWYPKWRFITGITKATQAVVTCSVDHGYKVGSQIRFSVSSSFGMTEINGLVGNVVAVDTVTGTTNTFTVDIDSTNFTTFAFPTSAIANQGVQFPQAIPLGINPPTGDNTTEFAFDNQGTQGLYIGSGVCGAASDFIVWTAFKGQQM